MFLDSYQSIHRISQNERISLPVLIRAQYAAYAIRTNYYRVKHKDTSEQTKQWFELGVRGLEQYADIQML